MNSGISRRVFLGAFPLGVAAQVKQTFKKAKPLPAVGEFTRVVDPVTENVIVRLTGLSSSSFLPCAGNRFVSARERVLVFSSDRTGHFAPFQIDLRTGAIRQIADPAKLDTKSLCLDRLEKSIHYLDGDALFEASLMHGAPHKVSEGMSAFSIAADGSFFVIAGGKLNHVTGKSARTLAEDANGLWPQPNSAGCLFARSTGRDDREFHYVPADGGAKPRLVAQGRICEPYWDQDGESILFLRDVTLPNGAIVAEIHGKHIDRGVEYLVAPTSQFASFAPNSDASVFVGASRSRAQPTIVLMLRTPNREMTLCEHRSSHPGEVRPVFSPDNRRIYFESDHLGHSAIYSVNVELLVEPPPG